MSYIIYGRVCVNMWESIYDTGNDADVTQKV